jgi:hypothetical protein
VVLVRCPSGHPLDAQGSVVVTEPALLDRANPHQFKRPVIKLPVYRWSAISELRFLKADI